MRGVPTWYAIACQVGTFLQVARPGEMGGGDRVIPCAYLHREVIS